MDPLGESIRLRADAVEKDYQYWGFADWIAWGWLRKTRVYLLLGPNATDLFSTFTLPDIAATAATWTSHIYVVACKACGAGALDEADWSTVNHFLHANPLSAEVVPNGSADQSLEVFEGHLRECLSGSDHSDLEALLITRYISWQWAIQLTVADGNCAVDSIAIHEQRPRTIVIFRGIRVATGKEMRTLSTVDWFRRCFVCAQEYAPRAPVVHAPIVLDDDAGGDGVGDGDSVASDGYEPGIFSEPEQSEESGNHTDGSLKDDAVSEDHEEAPVVPADAIVLSWAMERTEKGRELIDDFGVPDEADVLNIIALEELISLRQEYLSVKKEKTPLVKKKSMLTTRSSTLLQQRLDLGKAYQSWYDQQDEATRKCGLLTFARLEMGYGDGAPVPKAVRQKIYNCYKTYRRSVDMPEEYVESLPGSAGLPPGSVQPHMRRRRKGTQGRAIKGRELSWLLLQWFIDYRKVVKARIWPRTVLTEALRVKERIKAWYKAKGTTIPPMPVLDVGKKGKRWLRTWKRFHRISFKKCARKFKVSRPKLLRRTKTTWINGWSAMLIFKLLFGKKRAAKLKPPWPYQHTGDQKGMMMNEAESKDSDTFAFTGETDPPGIKTNHGQSRQRFSCMNVMTNDPAYDPPIQVCFKLKTGRCLQALRIPPNVVMSLEHSKSGSYNYETMMAYLKKHVPEWTPERAEADDYRLFYLDDYAVHNMQEVTDFLWSRGFLKIKLGGGTTFILCNCDLDLHADMEKDCLEMEIDWAAKELEERPWRVPQKTRQNVVDDVACFWHQFQHARRGIESFKLSGLAARPPERVYKADGTWEVPLTGPDDWVINRDARSFFEANNMPSLRKDALTKIYEQFDAGNITEWADVQRFHKDHSDSEGGGEHGEGEECLSEKPLSDGSETDMDEDDPDIVLHEEPVDALVPADGHQPFGSGELVKHGSTESQELRLFEHLIERTKAGIRNPRVTSMLQRYRKTMERQLRGVDKDSLRALEEERAAALEEMRKNREKLYAEDQERKRQKHKDTELRKAKEAEAAKKKNEKENAQKLALLVDKVDWKPEEFGHGTKGHNFDKTLTKEVRNRIREALQRTFYSSMPDACVARTISLRLA